MADKKEIEYVDFPEEYVVLGADLSLKRPSFCILNVKKEQEDPVITNIKFVTVDNKNDKKKGHGQLLEEINAAFQKAYPCNKTVYCVRENEIMKVKVPSERSLSKVVGIMDWSLWCFFGKDWYNIYPMTIKKLITGNGKATKEEVAEALEFYIGKQDYKCDDESDAAAVAIAWLIQQKQIKPKEDKNG